MPNLAPDVYITTSTTVPPRAAPTDTGTAFIAILSDRAPAVPTLLQSMTDYPLVGSRQGYSFGYDWADTYFHEGGARLYVMVARGPAAAKATLNLAGTGTSLVVTAKDIGEYANGAVAGGLKAEVINGPIGGAGTRVVIIRNDQGVELERTAEFSTQAAGATTALTWVDITLGGGSGLPTVAAAASLAGGTTDRTNVTSTQWQAALDAISSDLGPGQIAAPDWTVSAGWTALRDHAAARNRFALPDPVDGASKATLQALALQGSANASYMALYAPWINVPALASGGSVRAVPGSALVAARAAVTDAQVSANQAPAGVYGKARWATGVRATFSRDTIAGVNDAGDLYAAGINLIVISDGDVTIDGERTMVSLTGSERNLAQVGNCRWRMSFVARARIIGKRAKFLRVNRGSIDAFENDLKGELLKDYVNADLFGDLDDDRPETAFNVRTADPVNTAATIQAGNLNAQVAARPTKGAEFVYINITAVALTDAVA